MLTRGRKPRQGQAALILLAPVAVLFIVHASSLFTMNPELPNATSLPLTPTPFGQIALDSGTTRVAAPSKALPWLCREEYEALLKDLVENSELKPLDGPAIRIICANLPSCDLVVKFPTAQAFIAFLSLGVRDLSERILWMQKAKEKFDSLVRNHTSSHIHAHRLWF